MADNSATFIAFREKWNRAVDAGLVAAAEAYIPAVQARLQHGYTSSHYADAHHVANSIRRTNVRGGKNRYVRVFSNVPFAAFWELGHHNIFTRKYERVQHWLAAVGDSFVSMSVAFSSAFNGVLGA